MSITISDKCPKCNGHVDIQKDATGKITSAVCDDCFADFTPGELTAPGAEPDPAEASDASSSTTRSGSRSRTSGTRSNRGDSRLGSGRSIAATLGLTAHRKARGFDQSHRSSSRRKGIGGLYIQVPEVPKSDPRGLIRLKHLEAATAARTCDGERKTKLGCDIPGEWQERPHAKFPILRKDDQGLYVNKGICPKCKKPFDFTALEPMPLLEGELVAGQYQILGVIAKGGCGYIYIAKDLDLSAKGDPNDPSKVPVEQFAIIKAQINRSAEDDAVSAAEKQMLANLRDPSIVSIFRFTEHRGQPILITEWVDGLTVEQIYRKANAVIAIARKAKSSGGKVTEAEITAADIKNSLSSKEKAQLVGVDITLELLAKVTTVTLTDEQVDDKTMAGLTAAQAMAYTLSMCQSMSFLHEHKVLNPDIKPGNFMVMLSRLIQIDAGGWILATDKEANITSTQGYAPREVDDETQDPNPTFESDQYSLGRVAAVMANSFDFTGKHRYTLPDDLSNFVKFPSYGAWVRRACATDPMERFASVAEMLAQGWGVLREIVALDSGDSKPWTSENFDNDISGGSTAADFRLLPGLKVFEDDPARAAIDSILKSNIPVEESRALLEKAASDFPKSREAKLRLADLFIYTGDLATAETALNAIAEYDPDDWRVGWYIGKLALAKKDYAKAVQLFDDLVTTLPGEPAAKLALGLAAELSGDMVKAVTAYDLVTRVEPQYAGAAFGQARCLTQEANRAGAVEVLKRVPSGHIAHVAAELAAAAVLSAFLPAAPNKEELVRAAKTLEGVKADTFEWHKAAADMFVAAFTAIESGADKADSAVKLLGVSFKPRSLRQAAKQEMLTAAHFARDDGAGDLQLELQAKALSIGAFSPLIL